MALGEHLRELRNRIIIAALAIVAGAVWGWFLYDWVMAILTAPLKEIADQRGNDNVMLNYGGGGITQAFTIKMKIAIFIGIIVSSPLWLWQIWAFLLPGLTRKERNTALVFFVLAAPLFIAGCLTALWALPAAVEVLLGFTPEGAANLPEAMNYINFTTQFILWFGIAFLLPVFLLMLNVAGLLSGRLMLKGWRIAVVAITAFAAVMTPSPDPWTMVALAIPMLALYYAACLVSILNDRRRARRAKAARPEWLNTSDDAASAI